VFENWQFHFSLCLVCSTHHTLYNSLRFEL
jgi:hypothetical protein